MCLVRFIAARFITGRLVAEPSHRKVDSAQGRHVDKLRVDSSQSQLIAGRFIVGRFIVESIHRLSIHRSVDLS
jgi:hypothetical protein